MHTPPHTRGDQAEQIVTGLRADILSGALPPNAPLGQQEIAARFAVSRIPVREALRRLEHDGLVSIVPNTSARVTPLRIADLIELSEMRIAAETLALRRAVPNLSDAHIDEAEAIQTRLEAAPPAEFAQLNADFHRQLYMPAARPRLLAHIDALGLLAERYLRRTVEKLDYAGTSHAEHHAILGACRARDADHAVSLLTYHIDTAVSTLSTALIEEGQIAT
ncbi:GntR family transcriptional regulator [Pseudohalocynthiibacter aestuariivivens]|uniref:GntR family transcriptional regulator n=1 Tax=Roseovarius pelagicus TaxID=2980108 RepID=A0ABY6DA91_9RHOB|nr:MULTISPECIES: GntR family transcriptional regulator [Rhodobacterales]QIE45292.1 GntR family transcriptional regulator [Pseudohalocynthiibacter aestuariivivens]UXX82794.1 GntR family transcriptional regulator [Roseovarius pelagicus]